MEYQGKEKSPYYGVLLSSILLISSPFVMYLFFLFIFTRFRPYEVIANRYASISFGCLIAFLFQLSCAIAGLFKGTFKVVIVRLQEFFSNLSISFKFALKYYFENIKSEGIVFWIYFTILASTLFGCILGFVKYFELVL